MALPENRISDRPILGKMLSPDNSRFDPFIVYEKGGADIKDPTQGLQVRDWRCSYTRSSRKIIIESEPDKRYEVFSDLEGLESIDFTFDQNMNYIVAYELPDFICKLHWFDAATQSYAETTFTECRDPRLALDDKRRQTLLSSDVLFAYLKLDGDLAVRQQRDRFTIERSLRGSIPSDQNLLRIGMSDVNRLQFNTTKKIYLPDCGMGVDIE